MISMSNRVISFLVLYKSTHEINILPEKFAKKISNFVDFSIHRKSKGAETELMFTELQRMFV